MARTRRTFTPEFKLQDNSISEGLLVHPEIKVELEANNKNTDLMKTKVEIIVEKNEVIISEVIVLKLKS